MYDSVFYFILLAVILIVFGSAAIAGLKAAPWVPTRKKDIKRMIELGQIKEGDVVYDLGSGDGRLVLYIAKKCKSQVTGFELSLLPYLFSKVRVFFSSVRGCAKIVYKDFYKTDFSKADVLVCFLTPMAMKKLRTKFQKELKPGARIVSYAFRIKDWKYKKISKPSPKDTPVFLHLKE